MKTFRTLLFFLIALPLFAAQQTINTGTNPNDGAGDSLRTAFTKVNANFTDLYNTAIFSNSIVQWSTITNTPATLAGYGITNGITAATAASTYAPIASPTFTGTVTIPTGASIVSPAITGTPTVPTAAVDTSTTQAASTAFVLGQAASATPLINGTAAVGNSTRYARGDHVHPTDTTRAPLASPTFTGAVGVTGGAITGSSTPVWNATQTWNNAATTFTGSLLNITDTASAAASLFADYQVAGSTKLSFVKTGKILGNGANPYLFLDNSAGSQLGYGTGIFNNGGSSLTWSAGGTEVQRVDNAGLVSVASGGGYQWSSTTASSGTKDLILLRDAAATLAQRNGTTAQGLRVYNTFTDASNYERATVDFTTSANVLTIGSAKAGTGSSRAVNFIVGGVTALTLGTAGDVQLPKTITTAGTTGAQTINKASGSVNLAAAATSLVVTDSLVSTSSVIICTVGSNDTTCKSVAAVAASGSFTIYPNAAPTAETRVNFIITN